MGQTETVTQEKWNEFQAKSEWARSWKLSGMWGRSHSPQKNKG